MFMGARCKFEHEVIQMEKKTDCSYWLDGHCRFEDKTCWNIHDPNKKGQKSTQSQPVFQEGQEEQGLPPKQQKTATRLDGEEWVEPMSRKKKRKMKATLQEKETLKQSSQRKDGAEKEVSGPMAGEKTPTFPPAGEQTPIFPLAGNQTQQILVQVLATLLQQAGLAQ